jgi:hypothetical protein
MTVNALARMRRAMPKSGTRRPIYWRAEVGMTIKAAFFSVRQVSRRFVRDERGVILVLAGMIMPVLALIIGLGVEVGWWYALQRQNQSAADAAALSAAYEYAHSNSTLTAAQLTPFATAAANRNKYAGDTPIALFPAPARSRLFSIGARGVGFQSSLALPMSPFKRAPLRK